MAPFPQNKTLMYAPMLIQELGDFRYIRSPAKCAARIGQAFSQTLSSVSISDGALSQLPDIERNGRTFSDGVGTCSEEVVLKIWQEDNDIRRLQLKPTVFQIRFQGQASHHACYSAINVFQVQKASFPWIKDLKASSSVCVLR